MSVFISKRVGVKGDDSVKLVNIVTEYGKYITEPGTYVIYSTSNYEQASTIKVDTSKFAVVYCQPLLLGVPGKVSGNGWCQGKSYPITVAQSSVTGGTQYYFSTGETSGYHNARTTYSQSSNTFSIMVRGSAPLLLEIIPLKYLENTTL